MLFFLGPRIGALEFLVFESFFKEDSLSLSILDRFSATISILLILWAYHNFRGFFSFEFPKVIFECCALGFLVMSEDFFFLGITKIVRLRTLSVYFLGFIVFGAFLPLIFPKKIFYNPLSLCLRHPYSVYAQSIIMAIEIYNFFKSEH